MAKNKKASIADLAMIGVLLLFFSIFILIGLKVANEFKDKLPTITGVDSDTSMYVNKTTANYTQVIESSFIFFGLMISIITLIMASLVRVHPIFIIFYFIGLVMIIFVSAAFSNVYTEMAASDQLSGIADSVSMIGIIMGILPWFVAVFGVLLMVVMYKLWQNG